jgi:hypothetical protein
MGPGSPPSRREAILVCVFVVLTVLTCAGLLGAAALVPAPPIVLPFVIATCIACPMAAAWELRPSVAVLCAGRRAGRRPADARLLAEMRRYLEELPETRHPLDL